MQTGTPEIDKSLKHSAGDHRKASPDLVDRRRLGFCHFGILSGDFRTVQFVEMQVGGGVVAWQRRQRLVQVNRLPVLGPRIDLGFQTRQPVLEAPQYLDQCIRHVRPPNAFVHVHGGSLGAPAASQCRPMIKKALRRPRINREGTDPAHQVDGLSLGMYFGRRYSSRSSQDQHDQAEKAAAHDDKRREGGEVPKIQIDTGHVAWPLAYLGNMNWIWARSCQSGPQSGRHW